MAPKRRHLLLAFIAFNALATLLLCGWAVWVANDPEYWFPGAYAERGERGEQGPIGERGPPGPPGPLGPGIDDVALQAEEAAAMADEVQGIADDLDGRVSELESVDPYDLDGRLSTVESRIEEACTTLSLDLDTYGC